MVPERRVTGSAGGATYCLQSAVSCFWTVGGRGEPEKNANHCAATLKLHPKETNEQLAY